MTVENREVSFTLSNAKLLNYIAKPRLKTMVGSAGRVEVWNSTDLKGRGEKREEKCQKDDMIAEAGNRS